MIHTNVLIRWIPFLYVLKSKPGVHLDADGCTLCRKTIIEPNLLQYGPVRRELATA